MNRWQRLLATAAGAALAAGCQPAPRHPAVVAPAPRAGGPLRVALASRVPDAAVRTEGACEVRHGIRPAKGRLMDLERGRFRPRVALDRVARGHGRKRVVAG